MKLLIALFAGTFASEDLTCITAGQFIRSGELDSLAGVFACFAGIYLGDVALWATGRVLGHRLLKSRFFATRVRPADLDRFGGWFDRNSAAAILASRFMPGARLPMYLAAGALGRKPVAFFTWTFVAALLWTPLVVLGVATLGSAFAEPLHRMFGNSLLIAAVAIVASLIILNIPRLIISPRLRMGFVVSISRVWRWEFWPAWLFYLPLVPWIAWLALRHRSFMLITAANPGIPHGGIVGESKHHILSQLRGPHVLPSRLVTRIDDLAGSMFPLVLKPDAGQRGAGVRVVNSFDEARSYFNHNPAPILAQQYHPGPLEAGIFYYRLPSDRHGHIFSITDKRFPIVIGDGIHTLEELIWQHPRFRMQANTFLVRHSRRAHQVLPAGEIFQLARAGNHCQGTMFCDGAHLITPELERAIDDVARSFDGFLFGRFDVRYSDLEAFRRGEDFAIVELNGITSESTNVYDPNRSLLFAYRTLYRQWSLLFVIGRASRERGVAVSRLRDVIGEIIRFYRCRQVSLISD